MLVEACRTTMPCETTLAGTCGLACVTRFCTSTCARSGSVPIWNVTLSEYEPLVLVELMYIMFLAPLTWASIGAATLSATTSGSAPGYVARTCTTGGGVWGACAAGVMHLGSRPAGPIEDENKIVQ